MTRTPEHRKQKVLVTGAGGFVGRSLVDGLLKAGMQVRACVRETPDSQDWPPQVEFAHVPNIDRHTDWALHLDGISCVVHLAAVAHITRNESRIGKADYEEINFRATETLMSASQRKKVGRFVFLSSVKVHGETCNRAYREEDQPNPQNAYALTKMKAEDAIRKLGAGGSTEWVILRPPLVYGPGVKANFLSLLKLMQLNLPLPIASISERRSMIYVGNLVNAIICSMVNPQAAGHVFLVSDGDDLTLGELLAEIARAMGCNPRLFPFPPLLLESILRVVGKGQTAEKILQPLTVDISRIRKRLGWYPPIPIHTGISATVNWFQGK